MRERGDDGRERKGEDKDRESVGIYRVSSSERTPKGHCSQPDLKSIHQYF